MNIKIGDEVTISVAALYEKYDKCLTYGIIEHTEYDDGYYDDLYNKDYMLAVCDGETALVTDITNTAIEFVVEDIPFRLTHEEAAIAIL